MEVNNHPKEEDLLIFLVKDNPNQFTIVEFNIFANRPELEFTINAYDIDFIKINEDLSSVFLAKYEPKYKGSYTGSHKLYALSYGNDHDLSDNDSTDMIGDLGSSILNKQIIGDSIIVSYRLSDDTEMIETFNGSGTTLPIKLDFSLYGDQRFSIDQDNNNVY